LTRRRIRILALGGTIATTRDAAGAMQMGLGADDLVAAVPALRDLADIEAETVSKVGSHSLTFDQIHALAARIRGLATADAVPTDAVIVTQGTDTLEETSFLLDLLLDLPVPVIVTAAMRNPALTSPDGPGNLLAAVRVACDPWIGANARRLGVLAVMLDEVFAAADVAKIHPTRLNAFASVQTGPLAALVEDRVVPLALPVRAPVEAARQALGSMTGKGKPVALFWLGLDEPGRLVEAMLAAPDQLGYGGAVLGALGGGHVPEGTAPLFGRLAQAMPTVVSPRAGGGGPLLRKTYGGSAAEIALQAAGLIWGGRLSPVKARVLLDACLRGGLARATIAPVFEAFG
jgi:L-asparaginase